jgi:hypothetical protein
MLHTSCMSANLLILLWNKKNYLHMRVNSGHLRPSHTFWKSFEPPLWHPLVRGRAPCIWVPIGGHEPWEDDRAFRYENLSHLAPVDAGYGFREGENGVCDSPRNRFPWRWSVARGPSPRINTHSRRTIETGAYSLSVSRQTASSNGSCDITSYESRSPCSLCAALISRRSFSCMSGRSHKTCRIRDTAEEVESVAVKLRVLADHFQVSERLDSPGWDRRTSLGQSPRRLGACLLRLPPCLP